MQFHVVAVFLFAQLITCQAFWWLFGSEEDKNPTEVAQPTSAVEKIFAPFEISETETKFLSEASHYLGNLPKLDQCNLLVGIFYFEKISPQYSAIRCNAIQCNSIPSKIMLCSINLI